MALERLQILVDGNAQGAIREFEKLGQAADRELGKTDDRLNRISASLTSFGTGLLAGGAVAIGGLKQLADSASAYGEQVSAATVTFGEEGAAQLEEFAAAAVDTANVSKTQATKAANGFAVFARQAGLSGTAAVKFSTDLVQLGGDLSSFRDISVDEALQALQSALAGESEPVRRLGADISDLAIRAELTELGFTNLGTTLTAQQKIIGINSQLFSEFSDAQGDVIRTSDGLAGKTRNAEAEFENLKIELGQGLVPIFATVVGGIGDLVEKFDELPDAQQNTLATLGGFAAFGSVAVGALSLVAGQAIKFRDAFTNTTTVVVDGVETQKRSLNNLGRAAGLAAGALSLVAVGFTLDQFVKDSDDAKFQIDRLKAALNLKDEIQSLNLAGKSAEGLIDKFKIRTDNQLFFETNGEQVVASLSDVDRALGDLYKQGNLPQLQQGVDALQAALDLRSPNVDMSTVQRAQGILDDYRGKLDVSNATAEDGSRSVNLFGAELKIAGDAAGVAGAATGEAAGEIDKVKEAMEATKTAFATYEANLSLISTAYEGLEVRAGAFSEALERSSILDDEIESASSLGKAYTTAKDVFGALPADIDNAKLALGGYNEEQVKAIDALTALGSGAQDYLTNLLEQNKSNEEVRFSAAVLRDEYVKQFEQLGFNSEQINNYLEVLGLTPDQVETAIVLSGQEVAIAKIEAYQTLIEATPPEKLTTYLAEISEGDFQGAAAELDRLAAERIAPIKPEVVVTDLPFFDILFSPEERRQREAGRRAKGGPVSPNSTYLVGEAGPELFRPRTSGNIVPNNQLGGTVNITQNISSPDPIVTAAEVVRRQRDAEFLAGV